MSRRILFAATLGALAFASGADFARSQNAVPRFAPSRPTISPYLDLLRVSGGGVPNYYSIFRPDLQQRAFNDQQRAFNQQTQSFTQQQMQFNQAVGTKIQQSNFVQESARPTGAGSGFMTHQKFFKTR